MSVVLSSLGGVPGMSDDQSGEVDVVSIPILGTDSAKALAARVYKEMRRLGWDEREVRAAFEFALKRRRGGRPTRQCLEPSEQHMLGAYELWSRIPGHTDDKLGFAKFWKERFGGQSPVAVRKQLDRLIEADKNL